MRKPSFLPVVEHFEHLLESLTDAQYDLWCRMKSLVPVDAYRGRTLVVYGVENGEIVMVDKFEVEDFECDDLEGTSMSLVSKKTGKSVVVGYTPVKLPDVDVFVFLPLHTQIRWSAIPDADGGVAEHSLAFKICIKTQSRLSLREGLHYCETGRAFSNIAPNFIDPF